MVYQFPFKIVADHTFMYIKIDAIPLTNFDRQVFQKFQYLSFTTTKFKFQYHSSVLVSVSIVFWSMLVTF